jgi:hypothetical protein
MTEALVDHVLVIDQGFTSTAARGKPWFVVGSLGGAM